MDIGHIIGLMLFLAIVGFGYYKFFVEPRQGE